MWAMAKLLLVGAIAASGLGDEFMGGVVNTWPGGCRARRSRELPLA